MIQIEYGNQVLLTKLLYLIFIFIIAFVKSFFTVQHGTIKYMYIRTAFCANVHFRSASFLCSHKMLIIESFVHQANLIAGTFDQQFVNIFISIPCLASCDACVFMYSAILHINATNTKCCRKHLCRQITVK